MTIRFDSASLISGKIVWSVYAGHGIRGDAIPSTGTDGAPPLYEDYLVHGGASSEYRWQILTWPSAGTLTPYEDGTFTFTGAADGSYSFTYEGFKDGTSYGVNTVELNVGVLTASSDCAQGYTVLNAAQANLAQGYSVIQGIVSNLAQGYTVIGAATSDCAQAYTVVGSAISNLPQGYSVLNSAQSNLAQGYSVVGTASSDMAQGYDVEVDGAASSDMAQAYTVVGAATSNLPQGYSVIGSAQADLAQAYTVVGSAISNLPQGYSVASSGGGTGATVEEIVAGLLDGDIEDGYSMRSVLRILLAAASGRATGVGTLRERYYSRDGTKVRIDAQFNESSDRLTVDVDGS